MAEYLFRERLGKNTDWSVSSSGVMASEGQTPSEGSVIALEELGIDLTPHRSALLTEDRVDDASMIVVMTAAHMQMAVSAFPAAEGKIWLLNSFSEGVRFQDVSDPIGRPIEAYRATCDIIDGAIADLILYLRDQGQLSPKPTS